MTIKVWEVMRPSRYVNILYAIYLLFKSVQLSCSSLVFPLAIHPIHVSASLHTFFQALIRIPDNQWPAVGQRYPTSVTINRRETSLRIRMNGEMALRQKYKYGCTLWVKLLWTARTLLSRHMPPLLQPYGLAGTPHCSVD